jgi:hypothetical protein
MTERELHLRLQAVAATLGTDAPRFDPALLRLADRRRARRLRVAVLAAAAAAIAAPAAVSALADLFRVDTVPELGPVAADVTQPFLGRQEPLDEAAARSAAPFRFRMISSLGAPEAIYVREDVTGGMVTLRYGGVLLTQWPADAVDARVAIVPVSGTAAELSAGAFRLLWIAGTARGTFTLVGADGTVHRELFEVADGALLWHDGGLSFLLQGAGPKEAAVRLAAAVER